MRLEVESIERLSFDDGTPVRAASAVVPFGDGHLIVQDDATHAAWWRDGSITRLRLLPPVEGRDAFEESAGTKHLKPDLEAACVVPDGVLLLGSGSSPARMRWALVRLVDGRPVVEIADRSDLYAAVAERLGIPLDTVNLEGAVVVGDVLRWFHRGLPSAGFPSASVDVTWPELDLVGVTTYDLGATAGVGLAVTDVVALADGSLLVSAAAEDSPNVRDDGPVVDSALVWVREGRVVGTGRLPLVGGRVAKVEGLALLPAAAAETRVLAVVDVDDPTEPSVALTLRVRLSD